MSYIPLIARIESLPPLPESVLELEELFLEEYPDIDALVKIITKDPALTMDILAKVNAPFYGFAKSIISVHQAITLFGAPQIRSMVLSASMERSFDIDLSPYNITTAMYSQVSSMQSELLFQWYMNIDIHIARKLVPVVFLMEIGKILIAKEVIEEEKTEAFQKDIEMYEDLADLENIYTMMSTAQVNTLIFKHLNLNKSFWEVTQYLDDPKKAPVELQNQISILQIIRTVVNTQEQFSDYSIDNALKLLEENYYKTEPFLRAVKRIKLKYYE